MSLPSRIRKIATDTAMQILTPLAFMKSQQSSNNLITSGKVMSVSGSLATVQLDNGSIVTISLSNNQYTHEGARIDVAGGALAL